MLRDICENSVIRAVGVVNMYNILLPRSTIIYSPQVVAYSYFLQIEGWTKQ